MEIAATSQMRGQGRPESPGKSADAPGRMVRDYAQQTGQDRAGIGPTVKALARGADAASLLAGRLAAPGDGATPTAAAAAPVAGDAVVQDQPPVS